MVCRLRLMVSCSSSFVLGVYFTGQYQSGTSFVAVSSWWVGVVCLQYRMMMVRVGRRHVEQHPLDDRPNLSKVGDLPSSVTSHISFSPSSPSFIISIYIGILLLSNCNSNTGILLPAFRRRNFPSSSGTCQCCWWIDSSSSSSSSSHRQ